ncbi:hypothetical protein MMC14_002584 [Varicellaria rhodocarpa]|nr:hypothetical protein [Varicellaria rhodocarpa]
MAAQDWPSPRELLQLIRNACIHLDSAYSPPSPAGHSPDTTSPIYPDRPIRPLPRRPLRSRLSPEIADSILYPPVPHVSKPLFYHSYNDTGYYDNSTNVNAEIREIDRALTEAQKASNGINSHSYQFKGNDVDSGEEDGLGIVRRHDSQRQVLESTPSRTFVNGSSRVEGPPARSTVSSNDSVDGYDSFENTNNKKKRKIPTSGISTGHHSTLSAEMASMGISPSHDGDLSHLASEGGVGQYYGSGSSAIPAGISGTGISGAGRGRYGRSGARTASGRSPLGVSINGSNAWQVGRTGTQRREWASVALPKGKGKD